MASTCSKLKVDAGYAQSMVIVNSAKSISVNPDQIRLRMCRKAVNEVEGTGTTEHLETMKMECGDGRVPLTLCAVLWPRRLERGCEPCSGITSVIFLLRDIGFCESTWGDLEMSCNETMDAK